MKLKIRSPFYIKTGTPGGGTFYPINLSSIDWSKLRTVFGWSKQKFDLTTKTGQQDAYDYCPIISSIIDRKADFEQSGVLQIRNKDGIVNNSDTKAIMNLLNQPNPMQDMDEFERVVSVYYNIFGFCPIFIIYPANRSKGLPSALWPVNPLNFTYQLSGKLFQQSEIKEIISNVQFNSYNGESVILSGDQLNNIWMFNGKSPNRNDFYTAQSPLFPLSDSVNTFQTGLNVYGTLLRQSIVGIISNRTKDGSTGYVPLDSATKSEVQLKLKNQYGLIEGKDNFILSDRDLFFQSLLTNIGNLQIPEGLRLAVNEICNRLGFPVELLSNKDITFENKKSAEINYYNTQVIPYCQKFAKALTQILQLNGLYINYDFTDLSVLQENEKEKADVFQVYSNAISNYITNGIMTVEEAKRFLIDNKILIDENTKGN